MIWGCSLKVMSLCSRRTCKCLGSPWWCWWGWPWISIASLDDLYYIIEGHVAIVHDVLGLLVVALRLRESLDHQSGNKGHHQNLGLAILDGELDNDTKALPLLRCLLGDDLTDLLGGQTQGSILGERELAMPTSLLVMQRYMSMMWEG